MLFVPAAALACLPLQESVLTDPQLRASNECLLFPSLHHHNFSPKGVARLSFTARIEGAHSDRAASASKKDGLAAPYPLLPSSLVFPPPKGFEIALLRGWR